MVWMHKCRTLRTGVHESFHASGVHPIPAPHTPQETNRQQLCSGPAALLMPLYGGWLLPTWTRLIVLGFSDFAFQMDVAAADENC